MEPAADPPLRPVTAGAAMSATSRGLVAVTGAVTTVVVARLLGPEGAGAFAIAITLVVMLTTFATLGVEHGVAYHVSSGRWAARAALATVTRVALVTGTTAALVGLAAQILVPSAFAGLSTASVAVVVAAMPFVLLWLYRSYLALATDRYEGFVMPPAVQSTVALVLVLGCAVAFGLTGALVALTVSHAAGALATLRAVRGFPQRAEDGGPGGDGEPRQLARAVRFGIKGYAGNVLQLLNLRLDVFVLSAAVGAAAVGQLSVALAVTGVIWLLPHALSEVIFPRVATLSARADAQAEREMVETKGLRHAVAMIAGGGACIAAALLLLVTPVFGEAFRPAIELGLILLPGVALLGVSQVLGAIIVGRGRPEYLLYAALIVTPLTVMGYVLLVPALGATGAALVKSASFTLSFVLSVVFHRLATGDTSLRVFVPTRDELHDLVRLPSQIRAWARGR
ncbi:MAG: oligosaccharide flippase family protein [Solirubrobacteraceae bacterium MAG38_C4-C5]|nr:oligosaccharide flippase family protein [Candidatus Siliceabacter maunaloa]